MNQKLHLTLHYLSITLCYSFGAIYAIYFNHTLFNPHLVNTYEPNTWQYILLTISKTFWLFPFFYLIANTLGHLIYPPIPSPPPLKYTRAMDEKLGNTKIFFRFVTRGKNRTLTAKNIVKLYYILTNQSDKFRLPDHKWFIEVVTDKNLRINLKYPYNRKYKQIFVPNNYKTERGTLYKGRALHYALSHTISELTDWIFHLDEETELTQEAIEQIILFIVKHNHKPYPPIGQGIITYGRHQDLQGWQNIVTTLADSLRVSDDYGKFRYQFERGTTYFGIKGSFVLVNSRVAHLIGFDHGPKSSITEDAYFALKAKSKNIKFGFINAKIDERSPFTILDFIRQRRRWFGGLRLLVTDKTVKMRDKFYLLVMMITWGLSPMSLIPILTSIIYPTVSPLPLTIMFGVFFGTYIWTYIFGFFHNFRVTPVNMIFLFPLQIVLIPVFSLMEMCGVIYALLFPPKGFHIVNKKVQPIHHSQIKTKPNATPHSQQSNSSPHTTLSIETKASNENELLYVSG